MREWEKAPLPPANHRRGRKETKVGKEAICQPGPKGKGRPAQKSLHLCAETVALGSGRYLTDPLEPGAATQACLQSWERVAGTAEAPPCVAPAVAALATNRGAHFGARPQTSSEIPARGGQYGASQRP